ncbi:MAG: DUF535 family protein [Mariprofundaceae bacterium]|nr:DUF535 family protein [Mariprofundaceae bacterium]
MACVLIICCFFCVTEFCRQLGCINIYGISNQAHVSQSHHKTKDRIKFDYDAFWSEMTAIKEDEHWFSMPYKYPQKDISEVKTKKRGMYRKRYLILDEIVQQITSRQK